MQSVSLTKIILLSVVILLLAITNLSWSNSDKHHGLEQEVTATLDDSTIFAIFDQFNTYDIELATMAMEKGKREAIRNLARMIISDHPKLQQHGRDLAAKLGISYTVPTENHYASEHLRQVAKLKSRNGADFDKSYLHHEIQFSQDVVHAVKRKLIPAAHHEELKQFLSETLPKLEHHVSHMMHTADHISESHAGHGKH